MVADHLALQIQRLCMYKQIEMFHATKKLVVAKVGKTEAEKFFQSAKYVVALGSNDFINNYLMPVYSDSWSYNDGSYMTYLTETLGHQLQVRTNKTLHCFGAIYTRLQLCRFSSFFVSCSRFS